MERSEERFVIFILPLVVLALSLFAVKVMEAAVTLPMPLKLEWHYYRIHNTCRYAEVYVRHQVELVYKNDKSLPAKLLRLLYSDCFVSVCVWITSSYFLFVFFSFLSRVLNHEHSEILWSKLTTIFRNLKRKIYLKLCLLIDV